MGECLVLARFGVSVERELLARFDKLAAIRGYASRSEALRDLMRAQLVAQDWHEGAEVVGTITLVYDHDVQNLEERLTDLAHAHAGEIVSSLHVHLDERHCLEAMAVRGKAERLRAFADLVRAQKGVRHGSLTMTGTGR